MDQYNVTGMSCAACAARVEKAVNAVEGVTGCSVSLQGGMLLTIFLAIVFCAATVISAMGAGKVAAKAIDEELAD